MNPGNVSSPLDDAPPGCAACSRTVTSIPARARLIAHTSPFDPAPTTNTRRSEPIRYPAAAGDAPVSAVASLAGQRTAGGTYPRSRAISRVEHHLDHPILLLLELLIRRRCLRQR